MSSYDSNGTEQDGEGTYEVSTPARLHFGLFAFGETWERQYGGVGAMIAAERVRLHVTRDASRFGVIAEPEHVQVAPRVVEFAERWARFYERSLPPIRVRIAALPPQHAGLGVGTQLGLAVAAACQVAVGMEGVSAADWANSVGRGRRSAIGTYGFLEGGLIAERGRTPSDRISPLDIRCDIPENWRFLLMRRPAAAGTGLSGEREQLAFRELPPVTVEVRDELVRLAHEELIPAAHTADWQRFSEALFQYGRLAGNCFAPVQGGPYNGQVVTELVEFARDIGLPGVGQSSWGPTVFALAESNEQALDKMSVVREHFPDIHVVVSAPDNVGVQVTVNPQDTSSVPVGVSTSS